MLMYHLMNFMFRYGSIIGFRGPPLLPNQVYRLDPVTSSVRVVATDFNKSNGIAFTPDGKIAYMYAHFILY